MTYAFVNQVSNRVASGTGVSVSKTYGAHDRAVIFLNWATVSGDVTSVSDGTNSYSLVGSRLVNATTSLSYEIWECKDCAAGTFTVAASVTVSATAPGIVVANYSGLDNSAAAQASAINPQVSPGTGSGAVTTGNLNPTSQPAALIGWAYDDSGSSSITAFSGTNQGASTTHDAAFGTSSRLQDQRLTSTSPVASTFTAAGGTDNFVTHGIVLTELSPGPTINTQPQSATVYETETANFSISATTSGGTLHYQWKQGVSNVGTDSSSFSISPATLSDNGTSITCDVTDDNGTRTSSAALLKVIAVAKTAWISA